MSNKNVEIAKKNKKLADDRLTHKIAEIALFEDNHPIVTANDGSFLSLMNSATTLNTNILWGTAGSFVSEMGSHVGSIFGWSTSGSMEFREKEEYYQQMQHQAAELKKCAEIAKMEVERANISIKIAEKSKQIAELDLKNKMNHFDFAKKKY